VCILDLDDQIGRLCPNTGGHRVGRWLKKGGKWLLAVLKYRGTPGWPEAEKGRVKGCAHARPAPDLKGGDGLGPNFALCKGLNRFDLLLQLPFYLAVKLRVREPICQRSGDTRGHMDPKAHSPITQGRVATGRKQLFSQQTVVCSAHGQQQRSTWFHNRTSTLCKNSNTHPRAQNQTFQLGASGQARFG
jgi:hypothetical protein